LGALVDTAMCGSESPSGKKALRAGTLATVLTSRRLLGIALTEDSCLAKSMLSSQVVTSTDCSICGYKSPTLLPQFRMLGSKGNPTFGT